MNNSTNSTLIDTSSSGIRNSDGGGGGGGGDKLAVRYYDIGVDGKIKSSNHIISPHQHQPPHHPHHNILVTVPQSASLTSSLISSSSPIGSTVATTAAVLKNNNMVDDPPPRLSTTTNLIVNNCSSNHQSKDDSNGPPTIKITTTNTNSSNHTKRKWFFRKNSNFLSTSSRSVTFKWKLLTFILSLVCLSFIIHYGLQLSRKKEICLSSACVRTAASLLSAMDQSVEPCEDFFQFACGNWNKQHMIPEDRSSISTFEVLSDQIQVILKGLLEEPVNSLDSFATKKAKDFYLSCMNLSLIRSIGEEPLYSLLKELGGWPVINGSSWNPTASVEVLMGKIRANLNMGVIIELWIGPDDTNSSNNIIQIDQMQLGLPSRDYFLNVSKEIDAYYKYMVQLAIIFGADPKFAMNDLLDVIQFETTLANVSVPEADRHDTSAIYKKHTLEALETEIPDFAWKDYFETFLKTELKPDEPIVSYAFMYLKNMATIVKKANQRTVQNYMIWRVLMELTSHLVDKFQEIKIDFRKILMGVTSERSRWNQCVEWTNKKLGMALGALFIRDNFDNVAKGTAQEMISNIREAFIELLNENHWMDETTRKVAKEKAMKMNERIGYPDFLTKVNELNKEYSNLTISKNYFLRNIINMGKWKASQSLEKLRKPVNKDKWSTEPAVVNAFYDPNKNDIVFPAGILQPLFYSQYFPKSLNYGGIGVVIGHEITHGFDDKGRQFDSDGNLKEWWNNETIASFRSQAQCIIDQYSGFEVENFRINGRMTQGENIADNGGLKQAYRAFKKWESKHGPEPFLPGMEYMTHDQYFFLNYAQIWCGSMRPEDVLNKIRSAVHSPGPIRVLGPLSNSKDFATAYSCPTGSTMNPIEKCVLW